MSFADSLAAVDVLTRQHLGEDVIYTPGVGAAVTVRGVFDAAYELVDPKDPGVSSQGPAVFLGVDDLPDENYLAATLRIGGTDYLVWKAEPDGQGAVVLRLHLD